MNIGIARPFNAYGPRDDFFNETNHVIPGLMTRLLAGENPLTVWGTGKQTRTFLFVTDFVRGVLLTCAHESVRGPLNIGSDEETSIGELAKMLVELSGLNLDVVFDATKPDGQLRRACDCTRAKQEIGFQAKVSLREGLLKTLEWYKQEKEIREKNR